MLTTTLQHHITFFAPCFWKQEVKKLVKTGFFSTNLGLVNRRVISLSGTTFKPTICYPRNKKFNCGLTDTSEDSLIHFSGTGARNVIFHYRLYINAHSQTVLGDRILRPQVFAPSSTFNFRSWSISTIINKTLLQHFLPKKPTKHGTRNKNTCSMHQSIRN